MGFWDLSDGATATDTGTNYEVPGGGNFDPIPDGSGVLAIIDEAKWDTKNENEFLSLRWSILSPDEYKNRKVFQKVWVTDMDPGVADQDKAMKKRDKARRMLAAIDANAGGKLTAKTGKPTNDDLAQHLCNKPMIVTVRVWEIEDRATGKLINGNWVSAVAPKSAGIDVKEAPPTKVRPQSQSRRVDDDDSEIPF